MKRLFKACVFFVFFFTPFVFAVNKAMQARVLEISLEAPGKKEQNVSIRIKDVGSGKIAQATLKKSEISEGRYVGFFSIQFFAGDNEARTLEFSENGKTPYFVKMIEDESVQRILLSASAITDSDVAIIPAPAEKAGTAKSPLTDDSKKAWTDLAEAQKTGKLSKISSQVAVIERENRIKLVQDEKSLLMVEEETNQKRLALLKKQEELSEVEKKNRVDQAKKFVAQANAQYQSGNFQEAADNYLKATELDPSDDSYIYQYGVSLFKIKQYQKSLAVISSADVSPEQATEKDYYLGLIYMKLGDTPKALKKFIDVRDENDDQISPTAAFLVATIYFKRQKFDEARKNAEYVIDNSKDPKMDAAADDLIEQIDKIENYYASKKELYSWSLSGGLIYDDNVLNVANNNSSTSTKAIRLNYAGSLKKILSRSLISDWGAQVSFNDYYSFNSSLKADSSVQSADALELALTAPYRREIKIGKQISNIELSPYYKSIWLTVGSAKRSEILKQVGATASGGIPWSSSLLFSGRLDLGVDDSTLSTSVDKDDQDSTRMGLTITPTWLLDLKGEERFSADIGYSINTAKGDNYKNNKTSLAGSWTRPAAFKTEVNYRIEYSQQKYASATTPRTDTVTSLSVGANKVLEKDLNLSAQFQFTNALSDVDSYKYDKWMITSLLTWTHSILDK